MAKEILCGFGVDVDAVAGWLGSYGGEDSPDDISRGLFAGEVGSPRLLKLFGRLGIKTTWLSPATRSRHFPPKEPDGVFIPSRARGAVLAGVGTASCALARPRRICRL